MSIPFPSLKVMATGACVVLTGCGQMTPEHGDAADACRNLGALEQQYMQGTPSEPARCGPQVEAPWKPGELPDGTMAK